MTDRQKRFLQQEIWILTFGGAFQRANLYNQTATESDKKQFRLALIGFLEIAILPKYLKSIPNDIEHLLNIHSIKQYSRYFKEHLNGGELKLGVCQKLLNLLLKYHWCQGWIKEAPHFPIDNIIIKKINEIISKEKHPIQKITVNGGWTKLHDDNTYLNIIKTAIEVAKPLRLAEWELITFERN